MKTALGILTFQCNYACPYCQTVRDKWWTKYPSIDAEYWIKAFKTMPDGFIQFTGGEPFIYSGWFQIVESLEKRHYWYPTTNLSTSFANLKKFIDIAPLEQMPLLAASLHPSHKGFDLWEFLSKIKFVQEHGVGVYINFVAYPDQMDLTEELRNKVKATGAFFNVDPYIETGFEYDREQKRVVSSFLTAKRKLNYSPFERGVGRSCSAGFNYCAILPNGDVHRCGSAFWNQPVPQVLSNIQQSPNIQWAEYAKPCYHSCPAVCDQKATTITSIEDNKVLTRPIFSRRKLSFLCKTTKHQSLRKIWNQLPANVTKRMM
jgi:MoaA/NifB/PqqE/SkfB family radical SAM enzyme